MIRGEILELPLQILAIRVYTHASYFCVSILLTSFI